MNKLKRIVLMPLIIILIFVGGTYAIQVKSVNNDLKSIETKVIRFHVIANSDSIEDQALKLKVRDKVLEYISPKLKESVNIEESRKILKENDESIIKICETVIENSGFSYGVKTTLSKENFPVKSYGNITLPQGNYEAYRILIGNGNGKNWWCVMFPPLCFVDITKGEVSYDKTKAQMEKVLSDEEYSLVENRQPKEKIQVKFKVLEIIKDVKISYDKAKTQIQNGLSVKENDVVKNRKPKEKIQINNTSRGNSSEPMSIIHENRVNRELF